MIETTSNQLLPLILTDASVTIIHGSFVLQKTGQGNKCRPLVILTLVSDSVSSLDFLGTPIEGVNLPIELVGYGEVCLRMRELRRLLAVSVRTAPKFGFVLQEIILEQIQSMKTLENFSEETKLVMTLFSSEGISTATWSGAWALIEWLESWMMNLKWPSKPQASA